MSEEQESGLSGLKKTIIGVATTAVTAAGVYVTTNINKFFGVEEEAEAKTEQVIEHSTPQLTQPAAAAPIIVNIENTNQQKQSSGGERVIERVIEKPAPAKKEETSEEDPW